MQPDLIREIADAIVRDQLFSNWRFYAVLLGIGIIGGAVGNWIAPYVKKRAETSALKADMDEVLRQLRETTRTTEQIRVAVNQADWAHREWRTVRRVKLEELLSTAYSLDQWLTSQQDRWLHGSELKADSAPLDRLKVIAALYFPELKGEVSAVWMAHQKAFSFIVQVGGGGAVARLTNDVAGYGKALADFKAAWVPHYTAARQAIDSLETAASELMEKVAAA